MQRFQNYLNWFCGVGLTIVFLNLANDRFFWMDLAEFSNLVTTTAGGLAVAVLLISWAGELLAQTEVQKVYARQYIIGSLISVLAVIVTIDSSLWWLAGTMGASVLCLIHAASQDCDSIEGHEGVWRALAPAAFGLLASSYFVGEWTSQNGLFKTVLIVGMISAFTYVVGRWNIPRKAPAAPVEVHRHPTEDERLKHGW